MAASWGMPSVGNSGLSALGQAAAGTTPQMMYATMQQFQTQWDEFITDETKYLTRIKRWNLIGGND